MATAEKTVSALVSRQLPDFIRADHPKFKRFLELYYAWLEDESKGNTVYHIMRSGEYRDIDSTLDPFIRLFKQELLPYFPENSELDTVRILKGAREFYVKKGSVASVKWLFRVLYGIDVEVYYPKQQILIASDGKWKLPQAFQLTLSANNESINPNLLEKHTATGSISKATCVIESANKTIDRTRGTEILEMYVSNVFREFTNGENLEIPYVDEFGVEQLFSEKIIGSISGIRIDSAISTDPQQKRRGLLYNVGDPVVVTSGLADTAEAQAAVAVVGNVTVGSIEGLSVTFPGYGYRTYSNTEAVVFRTVGDDPNANLSTDVRVAGIDTDLNVATNFQYGETITVDMMPIEYLASTLISDPDYAVFTGNNRNIVLTVDNDGDLWLKNEYVYANGDNYATANFKARVLTANTGWAGGPSNIILYAVQNTVPLSTSGFLVGTDKLIGANSGLTWNVSTIVDEQLEANSASAISQALLYQDIETGGVALYTIINGGYGFRSTPTIATNSYYDTFWSQNYAAGTVEQKAYRQALSAFGKIAHIYIDNGGTGYANGESISVSGRGYGFTGNISVGANGTITAVNIIDRGEGYTGGTANRSASVATSGGIGASFTVYGFGEGVSVGVETGAIGRVRDIRMIDRGFDYIDTPIVSLKVVDMVIDGITESQSLVEGERVWQGASLLNSVFSGLVKSYNRSTKALRLYNFSGNSYTNFNSTLMFTSNNSVNFNVNTAATVVAPEAYPVATLPNPWFYGNGQAKAVAEFYNGLIRFTGFYLNTDGFLSSDKKLQDDKRYHNYSYVIESEKSLSEYENTMKDIVHPIGMSLLAKVVSKSDLLEDVVSVSIVSTSFAINANATVSVSNSANAVVTGQNTYFLTDATVGGMFSVIDATSPLRSQAKTIIAVDSNTSLNVESNFIYVGQGKIATNGGNNQIVISGNSNSVSDFLKTSDVLRMNVNNTVIDRSVSGISGNTLTLNTTVSTTNTNIVYLVVPVYTEVEYKISQVS